MSNTRNDGMRNQSGDSKHAAGLRELLASEARGRAAPCVLERQNPAPARHCHGAGSVPRVRTL